MLGNGDPAQFTKENIVKILRESGHGDTLVLLQVFSPIMGPETQERPSQNPRKTCFLCVRVKMHGGYPS